MKILACNGIKIGYRLNICNIQRLFETGIRYRSGPWFKRSQDSRGGAQIDLLFVRADKVLTLCEMKYAGKLAAKSLESALDSSHRECESEGVAETERREEKGKLWSMFRPVN